MSVRWSRIVGVAMLLLSVAACATPKSQFTAFPDGQPAAERELVWPSPPETPRFRFGGQLLGEANYRAAEPEGKGMQLLRWIVGADDANRPKRTLLRPQSGAVDTGGRVLVTDVGRQAVFVFDRDGGLITWERADGRRQFVAPVGIAIGADDRVFVADAELAVVVTLDREGNPLGSFGRGELKRPTGLARDPARHEIYVADTEAHDIKVYDDAGRLLRTLGGPGVEPGRFNGPTHIAFSHGRLVVSDTLNARVQLISPEGAPLGEVAKRGLYVGNVVRPKGVGTDTDGHIYVVEGYYDYLLVFDDSGRLLLPIGGTGNGAGKFFLPGGVWSDATNRIFVADVFNGRVEIFHYLGR